MECLFSPEEGPIVGHNLLQTVILGVVGSNQDEALCILPKGARCWVENAMTVHSSGFCLNTVASYVHHSTSTHNTSIMHNGANIITGMHSHHPILK